MSDQSVTAKAHPSRSGVGAAVGIVGLVAILAGHRVFAAVGGLLLLAGFIELRRLLGVPGSGLGLVLGASAIGGFAWVGLAGGPEHLPWVMGCLLVALLAGRVFLLELGRVGVDGATDDVAATVAAAGIIGVLGVHALLVGTLPNWGYRSLLVFGAMLIAHALCTAFGGRVLGRRAIVPRLSSTKTLEGAVLGALGAVAVGAVAGLTFSPPFEVLSGGLLGLGVGVLATVGDLAEDALKRGAGIEGSTPFRGLAGVLDAIDGPLFCSPFYYWALRTLVI